MIHEHENNSESAAHLAVNKERFSLQCLKVLEAFLKGERLTTLKAITKYGIGDLRRRIKDLKDYHHIPIAEQWHLDEDGKTTRNKEWFINFKTEKEKSDLKKFIETHRGNIYKSGDKTAAEHASDLIKATQPKLF